MPKYYAVKDGRSPGIYSSWDDCKAQTNGYSNAKFKSFNSAEEANHYINGSNSSHSSHSSNYSSHSSGGGYSSTKHSSGSAYTDSYPSSTHSSGSGYNDSFGGNRLDIYTDGACSKNGYGGARAGIGVHFPDDPRYDISEPLSGRQTNNRAEIKAVTRALEAAKQRGRTNVTINTDSQFLHSSVNEWMDNWKRNGWKKSDGTDVINKDDFLELEAASKGMDIQWQKVAAHKGVPGNEEADRLANQGIGVRRY